MILFVAILNLIPFLIVLLIVHSIRTGNIPNFVSVFPVSKHSTPILFVFQILAFLIMLCISVYFAASVDHTTTIPLLR